MPLDFPANPTVNDTYSFGGKTWRWNGSGWQLSTGGGAINDIPIGNVTPSTGAFTAVSVTGNVTAGNVLANAYYFANGDPFTSGGSNVDLTAVESNITPTANVTYDIGSSSLRFRDIYLANSTIHLGSQQISANGNGLVLPNTVQIGNATIDGSSGGLILPGDTSIGGATAATPRITSIDYPGDDTAADPAGGQTLGIVGSGFFSGVTVILDGVTISPVTLVSSTRLEITAPAKSAGSYTLYVINSDGGTGIFVPGVQYSGVPVWSSPAAGSLGAVYETANVTATFSATSDSSVIYSLLSGTLPAGSSLDANTGVLSGTANLIAGSSVTYSFTVRATDAENQDTDRAFSLTVDADSVTWSSPTDNDTVSITVDQVSTTTLSAVSAAGDSITYSANALPSGLTLTGDTITGTANTIANTSVALTATADTTTRSATIAVTFVVALPLGDEYFNQTTLLLNADNNTFITDASTNNFTITPQGDTRPSAFSPYNTGWSNYFDGAGDSLATTWSVIGANEFTCEAWVYITTSSGRKYIVGPGIDTDTHYDGFGFEIQGQTLSMWASSNGTTWNLVTSDTSQGQSANPVPLNSWVHIAMTRDSNGVFRSFINGNLECAVSPGTAALADASTTVLNIGRARYLGDFANYLGYMSNLRVVNGSVVSAYVTASTTVNTQIFAPPTAPLTAVSGTSLLTCQSNRLIDNSANNFAITRNGDVKVTAFAPFTDTDTSTGSGYFDGSGDYLSIPNTHDAFPLGTEDFTVEFFLYKNNAYTTSRQYICEDNISAGFSIQIWETGGVIRFARKDIEALIDYSFATLQPQEWTHFAFSRKGNDFALWVNGTRVATTTNSNGFAASHGSQNIGANGAGTETINGYISGFRCLTGAYVYDPVSTTITVPTSPLTAIANTSLLTLQNRTSYNNSQPIDESGIRNIITRNGNSGAGTFSPHVPTGWSAYFDGTGDYLTVPDNAALEFGNGDFTIEGWFYMTAGSGVYRSIIAKSNRNEAGGVGSFAINISNSNKLQMLFSKDTAPGNWDINVSGTTDISLHTWYHVAVTRSGNTFTAWLNGVSEVTASSSITLADNSQVLVIAALGYTSGTFISFFTGYISNLHLVKGTAVYTSAFAPPTTPVEPIANTSLLTLRGPSFTDDSANRFAITRNGDTKITPVSPFAPHTRAPDSHSVYFDGTGDYLQITNNDALKFRTGDFTVEGWFYGISNAAVTPLFSIGSYTAGILMRINSNPSGDPLYINGVMYNWNPVTNFLLNQWNHVALTRSSGTIYVFVNGVQVFTASNSADINQTVDTFIGVQSHQLTTAPFRGYVNNFRMVKGTAVYTGNFTPPAAPLTAVSGTSLLTCQSPTVIDNSTNAFALTVYGNSQPTQFNPFGETVTDGVEYAPASHGGSMYFPGAATDGLIAPQTADFNLSLGNWTIEAWYYTPTNQASNRYISALASNGTEIGVIIQTNFILNNFGAGSPISTAVPPALHSWQHVALVKNGVVTTLYIDGVAAGSASNVTWFNGSTRIYFGPNTGSPSYQYFYTGYVSGARVVREALYTSNFAVPTAPPSPTPSAVLLYNFAKSAAILDRTARNVVQTVGNARVANGVRKFGSGAMSFDGTGDYLVLPTSPLTAFETGDFTVEYWVYYSSFYNYITNIASTRGANGFNCGTQAAAQIVWYANGAERVRGTTMLSTNTWYHIAFVRYNGVLKGYVNGVQDGTTYNDSINYSTPIIRVGSLDQNGENFTGYMDDLLITKGVARYTANFTPPTSTPLLQ